MCLHLRHTQAFSNKSENENTFLKFPEEEILLFQIFEFLTISFHLHGLYTCLINDYFLMVK